MWYTVFSLCLMQFNNFEILFINTVANILEIFDLDRTSYLTMVPTNTTFVIIYRIKTINYILECEKKEKRSDM